MQNLIVRSESCSWRLNGPLSVNTLLQSLKLIFVLLHLKVSSRCVVPISATTWTLHLAADHFKLGNVRGDLLPFEVPLGGWSCQVATRGLPHIL